MPLTEWISALFRGKRLTSPANGSWRRLNSHRCSQQYLESLEDRTMLSAGNAGVVANAIDITGTADADHFEVEQIGSVISISINGVSTNYSLDQYGIFNIQGLESEDRLTVQGTSADDTATFSSGALTFNSSSFVINASSFEQITVSSQGGTDSALFNDTSGDDRFVSRETYAEMMGAGYSNRAYGFAGVEANASAGGFDRAYFYDSSEDDTLTMSPDSTTLDLSGARTTANHFERVYAYSQNGGNDQATITDSPGNDTLVVQPDKTYLVHGSTIVNAIGFPDITVNSTEGGNDRAYIYDSAEDDTVVMSPTSVNISHSGYSATLDYFEKVQVYSNQGGNDSVTFNDSNLNDVFTFQPGMASMTSTSFKNFAYGFDTVMAHSNNGGADKAFFNDSAESDQFTFDSEAVSMTSTDFNVTANDFEVYHLNSRAGGEDSLTATDSSGDDTYSARSTYSYMRSDGVLMYARGFADILVNASQGGLDRAYIYDTADIDRFVITPEQTTLHRTNGQNRAAGFERVYAYSIYGGSDLAEIEGTDGDEYLQTKSNYTRLVSGGTYSYAIGFPVVHAYAKTGGNDVALITDSTGNELFTEMGSYGQYETGNQTVYTHNYDSVKLYGNNGGSNRYRTVTELDAAFTRIGDWLYEGINKTAVAGELIFSLDNGTSELVFTDTRVNGLNAEFATSIDVILEDTGQSNENLSVATTVDGNGESTITVTLATDANGDVTTTLYDVESLINNNASANALVTVTTNGNGNNLVSASPSQSLSEGTNGVFTDISPVVGELTDRFGQTLIVFTDARVSGLQAVFAATVDIELVESGNSNESLAVAVSTDGNGDSTITVTLATDADGDITTTAAELESLLNNNASANALISTTVEGTDTSVLSAMTPLRMVDGTNGVNINTPSEAGTLEVTTKISAIAGTVQVDNNHANADITFSDARTTSDQGIFSTIITIELIKEGNSTALAVATSTDGNGDHTISVYLSTDGNGDVTSTAADIENAINNDANASDWVTASAEGDGSGVFNNTSVPGFDVNDGVNAINSGLSFTDVRTTASQGVFPEEINIELLKAGNNQSLTVSVNTDGNGDHTISVNLATDANGSIISTADDVEALLNNNAAVNSLVTTSDNGNGANVLNSVAASTLADGVDAVNINNPAIAGMVSSEIETGLLFTDARADENQGVFAEKIDIEFLNSGNNETLAASVTTDGNGDHTISVTLATDANGDVTTTLADLDALLDANANANALVSVTGSGDLARIISPMTAVTLPDGIDQTVHFTPAVAASVNAATKINATAGRASVTTSIDAVAGSVTQDAANANADVTFVDARTTDDQGVFSNSVSIEYVKAGNNTALGVATNTDGNGDHTITVSLATDGNGDVTTTAAHISAAVNNDSTANALVSAIEEGTGSGVVDNATVGPFLLADGVDANNSGLTFTDARANDDVGSFNQSISVTLQDPVANNQALGMTVNTDEAGDHSIVVNLATDANGSITSTDDDIATLLNNNALANSLISALDDTAGSNTVTAVLETTLTDGVDAVHSGLVFTDARATVNDGTFGAIEVSFVDPAANNAASGVVVNTDGNGDSTIVINLATDANGSIITTANDIEALINNDANANALVSAVDNGNGANLVTALGATLLTGGTDSISVNVPAVAGEYLLEYDTQLTFTDARVSGLQARFTEFIDVEFLHSGANQSLSSTVSTDENGDHTISVSLETDANGNVITTASDVADLLNNNANALVNVTAEGYTDGMLSARAAQSLSQGTDGVFINIPVVAGELGLEFDNADFEFTITDARTTPVAGVFSESVHLQTVQNGNNTPLSLVVNTDGDGNHTIVVNLATDDSGEITTTASQLETLINNDVDASALITATAGGSGNQLVPVFLSELPDGEDGNVGEVTLDTPAMAGGSTLSFNSVDIVFTDARTTQTHGVFTSRILIVLAASGNNTSLSNNVSQDSAGDTTITVTLATDANGDVTSTANDVAALLNNDANVNSLISTSTIGNGNWIVGVAQTRLNQGANATYS